MISIITLCCVIAQTLIAIFLFNILKLKDDFEKTLNAMLIILFFHLGTKFFILVIVKDTFLYDHNASGFGLSYGPLLYIATHIFTRNQLSMRSVFVHMVPFIICTLVYFINGAGYLFHTISPGFINEYSFVYQWFVGTSLLIYPVLSLLKIRNEVYRPLVSEIFQLKLLKNIAVVMLVGIVAGLSTALIHYIKRGYHDFDIRLIPYICLAVIPILILRYKMQALVSPVVKTVTEAQPVPVTEESIISSEKRYKKSALDEQMMNQYEVSLTKFMQKSKIYLEAEISLEELSDKTKIPKHHLTQLLNERFGKNFYTFINEYRIGEAMERLKNPDTDTSILSLAFDCGFNSKSSFNNYFKKVTGLTPSAFRKEQNFQLSEDDHLSR
jgi:AraC-like DNA-binding protein